MKSVSGLPAGVMWAGRPASPAGPTESNKILDEWKFQQPNRCSSASDSCIDSQPSFDLTKKCEYHNPRGPMPRLGWPTAGPEGDYNGTGVEG